MNIIIRLLVIASLALSVAACEKQPAPVAAKAALTAPTSEDSAAWKAYLQDLVPRQMEGITNQPFIYFLPGESAPDFADQYGRLAEKAKTDVSRGIIDGNMLAYASPTSAKMADLVIAAFTGTEANSMKGVRVLFIGKPADSERVKAAVAPAGVQYVFVEAK
ncbi:MAG: hypothetical protein ACREO8_01870 [Luteimonas sp.]